MSAVLPGLDLMFWRVFALGFVALGQTLFVLVYSTFPWWKTFLGRALFYKAVMLAVIVDLFIVARVFDFVALDVVFVILYIFLGFGVWWQFFAFLRVRRAGKQGRSNPNGLSRVSGNRETALTEREVDAAEVSDAANVAEAAAIETAAVAAAVAVAAHEAAVAESRARSRAKERGVDYE